MAKTKKGFQGFPKEGIAFFEGLAEHNDKEWFEANKATYEQAVVEPARAFIVELGEKLAERYPRLVADPRVNKSMFRLNRDIRFSADKRPYKTHLAMLLWDDCCKRMEGPGFYIHLEPGKLMIAGGMHELPKATLELYRKAVIDKKKGAALVDLLEELGKSGHFSLMGRHYKRVPQGYDKDHPRAELLKFKGLGASFEGPIPKEAHSAKLLDFTASRFEELAPLHQWLVDLVS